MLAWKHSCFNIDTSVRIEHDDQDGMQRLIEYISRCPFSLARMVKLTDDDKVMYRASHADCARYPMLGKVDTLRCPNCGGEMRIVLFIEAKTQADVIKKILKHCGLWKEKVPRPPPQIEKPQLLELEDTQYDYTFFDRICA